MSASGPPCPSLPLWPVPLEGPRVKLSRPCGSEPLRAARPGGEEGWGGGERQAGCGACKTRTLSFAIYQKIFFSLSFKAVVSSKENFYLCTSKTCSLHDLKAEQDERFFFFCPRLAKNKAAALWPAVAGTVTHPWPPDLPPGALLPP